MEPQHHRRAREAQGCTSRPPEIADAIISKRGAPRPPWESIRRSPAWRLVLVSFNAHISADDQLNAISAFRFSYRCGHHRRLDIVSAYYRSIGDHERALVFSDSIERLPPSRAATWASHTGRCDNTRQRRERVSVPWTSPGRPSRSTFPNSANPPEQGKVAEAKRDVAEMMRVDSTDTRTFAGQSFIFAAPETGTRSVRSREQACLGEDPDG